MAWRHPNGICNAGESLPLAPRVASTDATASLRTQEYARCDPETGFWRSIFKVVVQPPPHVVGHGENSGIRRRVSRAEGALDNACYNTYYPSMTLSLREEIKQTRPFQTL